MNVTVLECCALENKILLSYMGNTSVPKIHCNNMAINGILFIQHAVTEFHAKENNSAADIYG
jgi:hypothetical protein